MPYFYITTIISFNKNKAFEFFTRRSSLFVLHFSLNTYNPLFFKVKTQDKIFFQSREQTYNGC